MAWPKGRSRKEFNKGLKARTDSRPLTPTELPPINPQLDALVEREMGKFKEIGTPPPPAAPMLSKEQKWKMHAGNNWEGIDADREENPDRFNIPKDRFPEGMDLQWWTKMIYGQETKQRMLTAERGGWTPVHYTDFDNWHKRVMNGKFPVDDGGYILLDGMSLCARPAHLSDKARARDKRKADEAVALKEDAFKGKGLDVSGGNDPTALAHNKIRRSYERIEVPKE